MRITGCQCDGTGEFDHRLVIALLANKAEAEGIMRRRTVRRPGYCLAQRGFRLPVAGLGARADFPGGDAHRLYRSIQRLPALPSETRLFRCHGYLAPGRDGYAWETTVRAEREGSIHLKNGVGEPEFVAMRSAHDHTRCVPRLLLPSIQVNFRAGHFP